MKGAGKFFGNFLKRTSKIIPVGERTMTPEVQNILTGRMSSKFITPSKANEKALNTALMESRIGGKEMDRARKAKTQIQYNSYISKKNKGPLN